jgi:hypothetical protein
VYDTSSVDDAVASLNAIVQDAMEQVIPCGYTLESKFPHWFSNTARYYTVKKNYFHCHLKRNDWITSIDEFTFNQKLVKNTIKYDRV